MDMMAEIHFDFDLHSTRISRQQREWQATFGQLSTVKLHITFAVSDGIKSNTLSL